MRVVFLIDHLRADGAQRALKQILGGLAARGHSLAVVSMDADRDEVFVEELRAAGAEVRVIGRVPLLAGYGLVTTWLWLRARRFDVAVTMLFIADLFGRALARAAGIPRLISSIRARNIHYPTWKRLAVRATMHWVDTVVINSAGVRDFAVRAEGAPAERMLCIPNGVRVEDYSTPLDRGTVCEVLGVPPDRPLLASVGRLTHQKGFDVLLRAVAQLSRRDVHLALVGVGEDELALRRLAADLGLGERVHFAGYRRDVPRLLGALDLYVHPARFEGMPNALLEAMAAGCPIVATSVDGNVELIEDGVSGWLVAPDDVDALAGAIASALGNPAEARRRGNAAHQRARAAFSVEAMVEAWEQTLNGQPLPPSRVMR